MSTVNVFEYTDYRLYLADYYAAKKQACPGYSYKVFADKAGFKDKSCIYSVIKGKRSLPTKALFGLSQYLRHSGSEAEYFENLVAFNQASTLQARNHYFGRLCQIRDRGKKPCTAVQLLRRDQYDFYSNWYNVTIRSLIEMYGFDGDYRWLANTIVPRITPRQARKSVSLLERLGLIHRKGKIYRAVDKSIATGSEVASLAAQNFHCECADLAKRAIGVLSPQKRNISGLTLGISEPGYHRICEALQAFQAKVMEIADTDEEADRVYQLNFHLFPISEADSERKRTI